MKIVGDIMKNRSMNVKASRIICLCVLFLFLSNTLMIMSTHNYAKADADATSNVPPSYMNLTPASGSLDMPLSFTFSIVIRDGDGDSFDWDISCSNGQKNSMAGDSNGTKKLHLSDLSFHTVYYVWVNASDDNDSLSIQLKYTTRYEYIPEIPIGFDAITSTETQIEMRWSLGEGADKTYIEWNVIPGWILGEGTELYNGTGTYFSHSDLVAHRRYFYQAWSWNETDRIFSENYTASEAYRFGFIPEDGSISPIRKFFTTKKILWTFDDYYIQANYHPPHIGFTIIPEIIVGYGGHINIMTILFNGAETEELRNYSVVDELGWSTDKINKSLEYFSGDHIYPASHGWDYKSNNLNTATLEYAYKIINHTFWNWKNNFDIEPHFFLGGSTSGNYNITLALKKFSETYWPVYGEDFRWEDPNLVPDTSRNSPAVEFIDKPEYVVLFDPLFGCDWGEPCKNLEEARELFNIESKDKEILFIRGHPKYFDGTERYVVENVSLWKNWIDWIYGDHDLININHTQAIEYNIDRYSFKIFKNSMNNFTIDLSECKFDHNVLFSSPYENMDTEWEIHDDNGEYIGDVVNDTFYELKAGSMYYFSSNDEILIEIEQDQETPGFEFITVMISLVFSCIYIFIKKRL